jgi:electron transport complex protein RnfC
MKKLWDIHGGIHPLENKAQSLSQPIAQAPVPPQLILPLSQHIGAPAKPIVAVGEQVLKGQCIAEASSAVSAAIHAPSSGVISAIEDRPIAHPSGLSATCIVIETDANEQWIDITPCLQWKSLDKQQLISLIRTAGIAGMGGAGFPSSVKLSTGDNKPVDTLIINGTECEPYITADHILMRERATQIAEGIAVLAKILEPNNILVGVEDNKLDVVEELRNALQKQIPANKEQQGIDIEVISFPTKYPSGGEKQLIQILTGKEVPSGQLPISLGIVCQNIGTTVAIRDAVIDSKPLISRITTFTGDTIGKPGNYEILLGTPIKFMLDYLGWKQDKSNRVIMGGPMMGFAINSTDVPVVKTTNCILAPDAHELPEPAPAQACIRCGLCAEACPATLLPQQLYWFAKGKELDKLESHNLADCIECGACAYVCPSQIPLVQYYRASKAEIQQRKADLLAAEHSKQRFDARQQRLERLEEEKRAARKQRQAKAAANKKSGTDPKSAVVAAALARVNAKKSAPDANAATTDKNTTETAQQPASDDPVARALAKRAQHPTADIDPEEKLLNTITSTRKRLEKAREKLNIAQLEESPHIKALEKAVNVCSEKLQRANTALDDFRNET